MFFVAAKNQAAYFCVDKSNKSSSLHIKIAALAAQLVVSLSTCPI